MYETLGTQKCKTILPQPRIWFESELQYIMESDQLSKSDEMKKKRDVMVSVFMFKVQSSSVAGDQESLYSEV